jgi:hypothetical protein
MASFIGRNGIVKIGANAVLEVKSFSVEETNDTVETTKMGDLSRTHLITLSSWSGTVDVFWDPSDTTGQVLLEGSTTPVALKLYPDSDDTGKTYYGGNALVTGVSRSTSFDGMVEASISVTGTGPLTPALEPA